MMAVSDLSFRSGRCQSQLKIVLLGGRNSGKNAVGNLILGKEDFVTKERTSCCRRMGVVAGRWLTVVDTPGWWCDFSVQDTPKLVKREIISGVSLCSPGPHVFLLIVKANSAFTERRRRAVEEHVALLGKEVWGHCLLVLTFANKFEHTKAEECIERGGKCLQWLSEKCSQRCHSVVLDDEAEITELLFKVQKLVAENGMSVYEVQESVLQMADEEKRRVEEKARLRLIRVKRQRSLMREKLRPVTDIRIVLLGAKGSGKTSAMNTILGRQSQSRCLRRTAQCQIGEKMMFGRKVTVVDTPGWWMNYFCDESSIFDRREMVFSLSLCPPGPHVFLLVVRVDRAVTETFRRAAQEHLELISEHIWNSVILLLSFGDWLGAMTTEHYIESGGQSLLWLVEKCGNRYHVLNSKTKGDEFQVRELIGKIEELRTSCDVFWHYELEKSVKEQLEKRMKKERERANERLRRKRCQSQMAKSYLEKLGPLPKLRFVLVGGRKTGKSSCGNTILGRRRFITDTPTTSCSEKQAQIGYKTVTVLDTPGCFSVTSDLLTDLCAVLLVVNVSASFKEIHRVALEDQLMALGGRLWNRAMVLFSYGDSLGDTSIERHIESEGEPLQRLVEKCGNRYHTLDNKQQGGGAQVMELIQLMEEMMAAHRKDRRHTADHMCTSVSSVAEQPCEKDLKEITCVHQLPRDRPESSNSAHSSRETSDAVALPSIRDRRQNGFMDRGSLVSSIFALLCGHSRPWWTDSPLPVHLTLQFHPGANRDVCVFSGRHQTLDLVPPFTQHRMPTEEVSVHTLCHNALRERTLRRLSMSGCLQAFIDQWGNSSLEELESFIDSYFEMVWEQTMGNLHSSGQEAVNEEVGEKKRGGDDADEEALSSIDRKLTKLEILEEIRSDLVELRKSLEQCCRAIEELRVKSSHTTEER
ncbi:GTPase IMAP family member 8 [Gouania willdenowi]|uniref:GTPase IMAP family member 8 n=1 Tax=Gouania willdenowi TaxID=441366 RepID=UPI0010552F45|nr:GTPase IMAP family member 8-like [Gouania willdenowi]